jgi:hypothetical protein
MRWGGSDRDPLSEGDLSSASAARRVKSIKCQALEKALLVTEDV